MPEAPTPPPYDLAAATAHLADRDPVLGALIEQVGPCGLRLRPQVEPFAALLRSIVYQQLSGKAAATIYGRVVALFSAQHPTPSELLDLPEGALRGAGLSRAKTAAARDLATHTLAGNVPDRAALDELGNDAIVQRLTQVRGIGPWTVEMLLIFYLGRPDVLPATDLGVRKGFMQAYTLDELPHPADLHAHGAAWSPYRSVASWYLWRAADGVGA